MGLFLVHFLGYSLRIKTISSFLPNTPDSAIKQLRGIVCFSGPDERNIGQESVISKSLIQQVSKRSSLSLMQYSRSVIVRIFISDAFCAASSAVMV